MKSLFRKVAKFMVISVIGALVPASANAYVVWSGIYLGVPVAQGRSETIVNSSEDFIVAIETSNIFGSYWHGSDNGWGWAVNYGNGTIAPANAYLWRNTEDWWWVIGYHLFIEDDSNTFDDDTFSTVFW